MKGKVKVQQTWTEVLDAFIDVFREIIEREDAENVFEEFCKLDVDWCCLE